MVLPTHFEEASYVSAFHYRVSRLRISHLHGRTEWPSARLSITSSRNLSTFKRLIQIKGDRTTNLHSRPESEY